MFVHRVCCCYLFVGPRVAVVLQFIEQTPFLLIQSVGVVAVVGVVVWVLGCSWIALGESNARACDLCPCVTTTTAAC